jgi:hypothetical protein
MGRIWTRPFLFALAWTAPGTCSSTFPFTTAISLQIQQDTSRLPPAISVTWTVPNVPHRIQLTPRNRAQDNDLKRFSAKL